MTLKMQNPHSGVWDPVWLHENNFNCIPIPFIRDRFHYFHIMSIASTSPSVAVFAPTIRTARLTMTLFNPETDVPFIVDLWNSYGSSGVDTFSMTEDHIYRLMKNVTLSPRYCLGLKAPGPSVSLDLQYIGIFSTEIFRHILFAWATKMDLALVRSFWVKDAQMFPQYAYLQAYESRTSPIQTVDTDSFC